jgi:hypothetical protein
VAAPTFVPFFFFFHWLIEPGVTPMSEVNLCWVGGGDCALRNSSSAVKKAAVISFSVYAGRRWALLCTV